jgi:hypothetical protein
MTGLREKSTRKPAIHLDLNSCDALTEKNFNGKEIPTT